MRFRTPEFDIAMPPSLVKYWTAWNETDVSALAELLADAVTPDVEWNDPRDSFCGIDALEACMRRLRESKPEYVFVIASEIDAHHNRLRYRWDMTRKHRILMDGLDIVTLHEPSGLIERVDGFFGHPTPIRGSQSGVPVRLQARART